jgi:hypothetical protein
MRLSSYLYLHNSEYQSQQTNKKYGSHMAASENNIYIYIYIKNKKIGMGHGAPLPVGSSTPDLQSSSNKISNSSIS